LTVSRSNVVARQRRDHQHRGLGLHAIQRGGVVAETLEADQPAERLGQRGLFLHGHVDAAAADRADLELGLLVVHAQPVQQLEAGGQALGARGVGERRQRVLVELGSGGGEIGEGRHQGALGFVELIQHGDFRPFEARSIPGSATVGRAMRILFDS
jgi:hypothetical protein